MLGKVGRRRQTTSVYYIRLPACTSLFHYHVCIAELGGTCRRALGISVICVYNCISIIVERASFY